MRVLRFVTPLAVAACLRLPASAAKGGGAAGQASAPAAADVEDARALGRELFEVMDKVMAYKASHFGNLPRSLTDIGVDSLTRGTVRRLTTADGTPALTVAFRRTDGHALASCSGTNKVLEDSMLNGGPFEVECALLAGGTKAFRVGV